ncbi:MAG: hypothetical protein E4H32_10830 [Nitrospirales bacterium]|nr:MAG: hypothetical protein E4H32_10830 [Nitrospirales bacterium]
MKRGEYFLRFLGCHAYSMQAKMATLNHKQKGDVMGLRHWTIIFLALFFVGCESTAGLRGSSPLGRQAEGPPTLSFLSHSIPPSMYSKGDNPPINKLSLSPPDFLTDSRRVDPFQTILFRYDSWEINADVRDQLNTTAQWMNQSPKYGLRIEGHTDVRGTESYNMILGTKRAHAVKEYLAHLGIPNHRLETVSYGQELVACDIDDERGCHQYNRRAEFVIQEERGQAITFFR